MAKPLSGAPGQAMRTEQVRWGEQPASLLPSVERLALESGSSGSPSPLLTLLRVPDRRKGCSQGQQPGGEGPSGHIAHGCEGGVLSARRLRKGSRPSRSRESTGNTKSPFLQPARPAEAGPDWPYAQAPGPRSPKLEARPGEPAAQTQRGMVRESSYQGKGTTYRECL